MESQKYRECYPMTKRPRGLCLIINNEKFDVQTERRGSNVDANNLDILFEQLGFKNVVRSNLSAIELKKEVAQFAQSEAHANSQMAVVIVLSHGENGCIFGTDGNRCPTEWILEQFNNERCQNLIGKPKFFLFQACRGHDDDKGVICHLGPTSEQPAARRKSTVETDASGFMLLRKPTWKDILIGYATVPGYVANRDINTGSWYIEAICKVFMNNAADKDIREMMDEVSKEMDEYQSDGLEASKQSSTYEVRGFNKKLYFNPGLFQEALQQTDLSRPEEADARDELVAAAAKETEMRFQDLSFNGNAAHSDKFKKQLTI